VRCRCVVKGSCQSSSEVTQAVGYLWTFQASNVISSWNKLSVFFSLSFFLSKYFSRLKRNKCEVIFFEIKNNTSASQTNTVAFGTVVIRRSERGHTLYVDVHTGTLTNLKLSCFNALYCIYVYIIVNKIIYRKGEVTFCRFLRQF
jgi:hypothetical protein